LGNGNKDQQLMHIQTIIAAQAQGMQIGVATPQNIYNALIKLTENAGFKDTESFWTDPSKAQPQPPKPDPNMLKIQAEQQYNQQKLELDKQMAMGDMALEKWKAEQQMLLEKYKAELKAQSDFELQNMKAGMQQELEVTKMQMQEQRESVSQMHEMAMNRSQQDESAETSRVERETKLLETMANLADKMSKPKVATLSNGKQVRIQSE
jgi:hypothetical protein